MGRLTDVDELVEYLQYVTVTDGITFETGFKQILNDIKNAPTIEAEPVKHGKWIEKYGTWYCTECDKTGYKGYIPAKPSDYCPNCGARMDGGAEK